MAATQVQDTYYKNEIKKLDMKNLEIVTPWLEIEDYPKLLGAATLGNLRRFSAVFRPLANGNEQKMRNSQYVLHAEKCNAVCDATWSCLYPRQIRV
mgnify:CR=1 FL=1